NENRGAHRAQQQKMHHEPRAVWHESVGDNNDGCRHQPERHEAVHQQVPTFATHDVTRFDGEVASGSTLAGGPMTGEVMARTMNSKMAMTLSEPPQCRAATLPQASPPRMRRARLTCKSATGR